MVSAIHIPDKTYKLSCRILCQYLLPTQGQFHDLKVSCTLKSYLCLSFSVSKNDHLSRDNIFQLVPIKVSHYLLAHTFWASLMTPPKSHWHLLLSLNLFLWFFSNFTCLQIIMPFLRAVPLQKVKAQTEACWKRLDSPRVKQSLPRRVARTVWFARTGPWTGCSCPADTRVCAMVVWGISSGAPCAGSSFRNRLHFTVKRSKRKTNWKPFEDVVTTEKYNYQSRCRNVCSWNQS